MIAVGVDSGGTGTYLRMRDASGPLPERDGVARHSISSARGDRSARHAMRWIADQVLAVNADDIVVWIGAAGFSATTSRELTAAFASELEELRNELDRRSRSCEMFIANDAVSILKCPPLNGTGVAAIVGTGSVVLGAHPAYQQGIAKRGGLEWLVTDEGSGVWMTLECIRRLIRDIEARGSDRYRSALLDRLVNRFQISDEDLSEIGQPYQAAAAIELVARRIAAIGPDTKKQLAGFVYPELFDLASNDARTPSDPIAAAVIEASAQVIADDIGRVTATLAAQTSDDPREQERLPVVVGGNIAANETYAQVLRMKLGGCTTVSSVDAIGDPSIRFAELAFAYASGSPGERRQIERSFDPLHPVQQLM